MFIWTNHNAKIYNLFLNRKAFYTAIVNYKLDVWQLLMFSMLYVIAAVFMLTIISERHLYISSVLELSIVVDSYSAVFLFTLLVISCCVQMWSYYYLDCEPSYVRFKKILAGFILSIVIMIFLSNLFFSFVGWDLLGITSFLLVIYYKNRKSLGSGIITALTNRLGDCFFFCLLALQLWHITYVSTILLIMIGMTKRAQIPFRAWLPAAIAAPTPVRALVHSSTLVTAGVYLLIRYCTMDIRMLLLIGSLTLVSAGFRACAERDYKKIVALRTLSQLGVIFVSLGAHEKNHCFSHLISHAYFKALLFICVGNLIHSRYGTQDFRRFEKAESPFIFVSTASLIGIAFTSGYKRKDTIIEALYRNEAYSMSIVIFLLGIGLTAAYSAKMLYSAMRNTITPTRTKYVKAPTYTLAIFSVIYGSFSGERTILTKVDMLLPSIIILLGLFLGRITYIGPWARLLDLPYITQSVSSWKISVHNLDKGFEAIVKTPRIFSNTIPFYISRFCMIVFSLYLYD